MKVCMNCGTLTKNPRKRVCRRCKAPAIWRPATAEEIAAVKASDAAAEALLREFLEKK